MGELGGVRFLDCYSMRRLEREKRLRLPRIIICFDLFEVRTYINILPNRGKLKLETR